MSTIMETMSGIIFTGNQQAELASFPLDPAPLAADEISGRTLVSLTSPGTELNFYVAEHGMAGSPGYAAVMEVEAIGAAVTNVAPGARVFLMGPHRSRQRTRCASAIPIPTALAPEIAVFCRLMGVSWTTLVTTTARPPDRVLVTGLGIIGNLAAQIFQAAGYRVTAVDPFAARRELAQQSGLLDVRASAPTEGAEAGQFGLAVECSGHEQAVLDCCACVRKRGEVVLVGVPWRKRTEISAFELLHRVFHDYIVLRSGWEWELPLEPRQFTVGNIYGNLAGALEWLAQGRVNVAHLYRCAAPSGAQAVYQDLLHQRGPLSVVFDWSQGEGA